MIIIVSTWCPNRERVIRVTKIITPGIKFQFFKMEGPRAYEKRLYVNG